MSECQTFATLSLAELFRLELPEPAWLIPEMLPLGVFALLSGREKAGKSLLALDIAVSVASGDAFLQRPVKQGSVLLVPGEDALRDVRGRVATRLGDRRGVPFHVLPLDGHGTESLTFTDPVSLQKLFETIRKLNVVLTILDPFREFHDLSENDSDRMAPLLRPLRQIAHQTNSTLVLVHHQSRAGHARGSTAIKASCDIEIAFQRSDDDFDQGPPAGRLRIEGRFGPRQVIGARLGDQLRWQVVEGLLGGGSEAGATVSARGRILAALAAAGRSLTAPALAEATGDPLKTVQNAISGMLHESSPPILSFGSGTKGDARRFARAGDDDQIVPSSQTRGGSSGGNNLFHQQPFVPPGSGSNGSNSAVVRCFACKAEVPAGGVCPRCHPPPRLAEDGNDGGDV